MKTKILYNNIGLVYNTKECNLNALVLTKRVIFVII